MAPLGTCTGEIYPRDHKPIKAISGVFYLLLSFSSVYKNYLSFGVLIKTVLFG